MAKRKKDTGMRGVLLLIKKWVDKIKEKYAIPKFVEIPSVALVEETAKLLSAGPGIRKEWDECDEEMKSLFREAVTAFIQYRSFEESVRSWVLANGIVPQEERPPMAPFAD